MATSLRWLIAGLLIVAISPAAGQRSTAPKGGTTGGSRTGGDVTGTTGTAGSTYNGSPGSLEGTLGNVGSAPSPRTEGSNTGSAVAADSVSDSQSGPSEEDRAQQLLEEYGNNRRIIGSLPIIEKMYRTRP